MAWEKKEKIFEELLQKHNLPSSLLDKSFSAFLFLPATDCPNMVTDSFSVSLIKWKAKLTFAVNKNWEQAWNNIVWKLAHL